MANPYSLQYAFDLPRRIESEDNEKSGAEAPPKK